MTATPNNADPNTGASTVANPEPSKPDFNTATGYPEGGPSSVPAEPATAETRPPEQKPDAVETKATPEEIAAANERLKQQNAANEKLIRSLGLDPQSDLAEQLESGVISQQDVVDFISKRAGVPRTATNVRNVTQTTDQPPKGPVETAQAAYEAAKQAYDAEAASGDGVTIKTNTEYIEAIHKLNEARNAAISDMVRQRDLETASTENLEAVLTIARTQPGYNDMPAEIRRGVDDVSVAMTSQIIERAALDLGLDPSSLNKRQVAYFAQQANKQLGLLAEYQRELGRQEVRKAFSLRGGGGNPPGGSPPNPAPAAGPVVTPAGERPRITMDNMSQMARDYASGSGRAV
jgi:uncharacterized protein YdbL (DUF1318 family)